VLQALTPRTRLYVAGLVLLLLALVVFIQAAFDLTPRIRPSDPSQILPLYVLSTSISLVLIVFGFILSRSLFKLWMDKKSGRPGSRFRTRLVLSMIGLTLIPAAVLFVFSLGLVNRSIDKWFSTPVETIFEITDRMQSEWRAEQDARTAGILDYLSLSPPADPERAARDFGLDAVAILDSETALIIRGHGSPEDLRDLSAWVRSGSWEPLVRESSDDGRARGAAPVAGRAEWVAIVTRPDNAFGQIVDEVRAQGDAYEEHRENRQFYRDAYLNIILLITILVLFAAVWTGLHLSRRITVPIEALSGATREISSGNMGYRVNAQADDELGVLVGLFNDMAERIENASTELDERRRYTEIILESIPTGVVSMDDDYRVTKINRAARTMFSITDPERLREVFADTDIEQIGDLLERCRAEGTASSELILSAHDRPVHSAVLASRLRTGGFVLVVEDLTEVVKAQTASAWREVARRLAHEIRNPLTPIQLSAERIARNVEKAGVDSRTIAIVNECVASIKGEVESLEELVDEFGRVARLPAISKKLTALKPLVQQTLSLYEGRLTGTSIRLAIPDDLPSIPVDAQQIKRVLINLLDNALQAMAGMDKKRLAVECEVLPDRQVVRITVADSGRGISREDRERLFSPYFSTRKDGTGLGLAISSRIVADHGGHIGAESNGAGARFVVELPICHES
jgi:nitrogen fixation/metabolism regulation signal transduction histidine kinase